MKQKSALPTKGSFPLQQGGGMKGKIVLAKPTADDIIENPLDAVDYRTDQPNTLEEDCQVEAATMLQALMDEDAIQVAREKKQAYKNADRRIRDDSLLKNDTEYWCCLVFESREQKESFLNGMGWTLLGDKYLNGLHLARKQGITLPDATLPTETGRRNSRFDRMVSPDLDE